MLATKHPEERDSGANLKKRFVVWADSALHAKPGQEECCCT